MRRILLLFTIYISTLCGVGFSPLHAETVSQKQAKNLAQLFLNEANGQVLPPVSLAYTGRHLTTDRLFIPFYVYNAQNGGFVIISAENKTFPILGYSLKENFDPNNIGPKLKALLTSYALGIEQIRYNSEIPTQAIKAWTEFPEYVNKILTEKYDATDPDISMSEADERIDLLIRSGKAEETASDIFFPAQWEEMINTELAKNKNIPIAFITGPDKYETAIIHGRKGDYYRMQLDKRNQWLMRLLPSEILSGAQLADFSYPVEIPIPLQEEIPFSFLDSYIEIAGNELQPPTDIFSRSLDTLIDSDPIVKGIGGGHYEIVLPEDIKMMTVYNLSGAVTGIQTFKNTNVAHTDLSIEPSGFYFAIILGESGKPYGVKLVR